MMTKVETVTYILVAIAISAYLAQRKAKELSKPPDQVQINNTDELDPTRYSHTGLQPIAQFDGNKVIDREIFANTVDLMQTLNYD
jgi:hypothetical protein